MWSCLIQLLKLLNPCDSSSPLLISKICLRKSLNIMTSSWCPLFHFIYRLGFAMLQHYTAFVEQVTSLFNSNCLLLKFGLDFSICRFQLNLINFIHEILISYCSNLLNEFGTCGKVYIT